MFMSITIIAYKIRVGSDGIRKVGIYRDLTQRGLPGALCHDGKSRSYVAVIWTQYDKDFRELG